MCGAAPADWQVLGRRLDRSQGWRPGKVVGAATTVVRCRRCRTVFAEPMPLPTAFADHYETDPTSYFGSDRAGPRSAGFGIEIEEARALLPRVTRPAALDIGSGTGSTMAALAGAGFEVWGLEPSQSFRAQALGNYGLDAERILPVRLEEASFPEASFDLITFGAVLEHLPDPGRSIRRALSWLRPKGVIHAEVPSSAWIIGRLLNLYFRLIGSGLVTNLSPMHAPFHLYEFSKRSFVEHGRREGYAVVGSRRVVGDTPVGGVVGSLLGGLMRATGTGMQLVVWLRAASPSEGA